MIAADCILANGDSYSVSQGWPEYLSSIIDLPCHNLAVAGVSNDRIVRTTIEYVEKLRSQGLRPYIIIGWSFIHRVEVWYHGPNESVLKRATESNLQKSSRLVTLDWIPNEELSSHVKEQMVSVDTVDKKIIDWYTNIFLLSKYLQLHNLGYFFFSAADNKSFPIDTWSVFTELCFVQEVQQDRQIYKLHDFCIADYARKNDKDRKEPTGHLSAKGHEHFSHFLLELLKNDIQPRQTS